jgi:hypothetical protein
LPCDGTGEYSSPDELDAPDAPDEDPLLPEVDEPEAPLEPPELLGADESSSSSLPHAMRNAAAPLRPAVPATARRRVIRRCKTFDQ